MKKNQLNRGGTKQVMYIENKDGDIDGVTARIGWVTFSKSGLSVYYRNRTLMRSNGQGILGNYYDKDTGEEYWVSGIKRRCSNRHYEPVSIKIDRDALAEYERIRLWKSK